jgi:hypothetical protein
MSKLTVISLDSIESIEYNETLKVVVVKTKIGDILKFPKSIFDKFVKKVAPLMSSTEFLENVFSFRDIRQLSLYDEGYPRNEYGLTKEEMLERVNQAKEIILKDEEGKTEKEKEDEEKEEENEE